MEQKIKRFIEEHRMLTSEDRVIIGVSGGADSVCLLFVLLKLQREMGFALMAVHVHHGLRGASADADEAYVKKLCEEQKVRLYTFHTDVESYAKEHGVSVEEAGREVRRECFRKVLEEQRGTRIALAHHRNDNAETVLWNLCRGSDLVGLCGITPKNGVWIRPLLCLSRREIELYLRDMGITYCTDETNLENLYTRNKIRNRVLPFLENEINAKAVEHIHRCAEQLQMYKAFIEEETGKAVGQCVEQCSKRGGLLLREEHFREVPEALRKNVIYECICELAGKRKDIEMTHVKLVEDFFTHQVGQKLDLPYNIEAIRSYEGIQFRKKASENAVASERLEDTEQLFGLKILERTQDMETFPQKLYTKWFDYDIIEATVRIRHRMPGDYIVINRAGDTQRLKQYFINEKIPAEVRDEIWLVADGSEILWIVGYRQSQAYQITERTKRILEIEFYGGEDNGRVS